MFGASGCIRETIEEGESDYSANGTTRITRLILQCTCVCRRWRQPGGRGHEARREIQGQRGHIGRLHAQMAAKAMFVVLDDDPEGRGSGGIFLGGCDVHQGVTAEEHGAKKRRKRTPSSLQVVSFYVSSPHPAPSLFLMPCKLARLVSRSLHLQVLHVSYLTVCTYSSRISASVTSISSLLRTELQMERVRLRAERSKQGAGNRTKSRQLEGW